MKVKPWHTALVVSAVGVALIPVVRRMRRTAGSAVREIKDDLSASGNGKHDHRPEHSSSKSAARKSAEAAA